MRILTLLFLFVCSALSYQVAALELQGAAVYQRLQNDVYIASIHSGNSDSRAWLNSSAPLRLEMRILALELSPRRFYRLWNEGLAINLSQRQMNEQVDELTRFMYLLKDDLVEGDHIVISNETGKTRVAINGVELLVVSNPKMVKSLLNVWIGKYPRSQQFKERLINMSASDRSSMKTRLAGRNVDSDRVAVIEGWVKPSKRSQADQAVAAKTGAEAGAKATAQEDSSSAEVAGAAATVGAAVTAAASSGVAAQSASAESASGTATSDTDSAVEEQGPAPEKLEAEEQGPTPEELEAQRVAEEAAAREAAEAAERERQEQMLRVERQLAESTYYRNILNLANGKVKYPRSALKRKLQGVTRVNVLLNRDGTLNQAQVVETSGHSSLDKAAIKAAAAAAPYPAIPTILEGEEFEFDVPFRFVMRAQ